MNASQDYRRLETDNASLRSLGGSSSTPQVHPSAAAESAARKLDELSPSDSSAVISRQNSSWTQHQEPVPFFDAHGQQAPYKQGPYLFARDKDGRVVKKRWCEYPLLVDSRAYFDALPSFYARRCQTVAWKTVI
jgi:hypothetical protein